MRVKTPALRRHQARPSGANQTDESTPNGANAGDAAGQAGSIRLILSTRKRQGSPPAGIPKDQSEWRRADVN